MTTRYFLLIGTMWSATLAACAHSEQAGGYGKIEPSGFLKDYSKLHPAKDETEATLVYFLPDKDKFKNYRKVWLEPVQVWRGEKSDAKEEEIRVEALHLPASPFPRNEGLLGQTPSRVFRVDVRRG